VIAVTFVFREATLTVWIKIGATPVSWNLVLRPLRIALVPSRWSESAYKSQNAPRLSLVRQIGEWTYGLENDIGSSSELLQIRNIVEGPKNGLEPQLLEGLGLFGRAKEDGDLVVGSPGVLDEVGKGVAANVAWATAN